MQRCRPGKRLTGLTLGLALTSQAHASELSPNVDQLGDGLLALVLYVPAGLLLAAVSLEILARRDPSSSLHNGVLTILAAALVASIIALATSLAAPDRASALLGSPFASLLTGGVFAGIALIACLTKGFSLRYKATAAKPGRAKPKPKRRGARKTWAQEQGRGGGRWAHHRGEGRLFHQPRRRRRVPGRQPDVRRAG